MLGRRLEQVGVSTRVKLVVAACLEHLWDRERFPICLSWGIGAMLK